MRGLFILSLVSTALSTRHGPAKARRIENRGLQDLNLDAAAIFPHPMEKRGLLDGVLNTVVPAVVTPLVTALAPATTLAGGTTLLPTAPSSNAQAPTTNNNPANPTTNNPDSPGASPTSSANPPANTSNGNSSAGSTGGSGNASKDNNGVEGTNIYIVNGTSSARAEVVTDHFGHSLTITGVYTMTYVTTLPNGVVSTVTEVITPTFEVTDSSRHASAEPGKIAAIAGTIVVVFLVTFAVAFAFLMMRKKQKRRAALLHSRSTSVSSFGSASDEFVPSDERRNSRAALAPSASVTSFSTARAYVDGTRLEFPLPPAPVLTASRPPSNETDNTFDFSQYGKSRASIIADRNKLRKIGQYPDAESYTPFVLPPSTIDHGTEGSVTPRASVMVDGEKENPFTDPVTIPQTIHSPPTAAIKPLANNVARQSTLWRSATFGPGIASAPTMAQASQPSPSRNTMTSLTSSTEYGTAQSHRDTYDSTELNSAPGYRLSNSTGRYSYHSAFEAYAQGKSRPTTAENPFADLPPPPTPYISSPQPVVYPTLRPTTGSSGRPNTGTSAVSSVGNGTRELGPTPDPKDLFYRNSGERRLSAIARISEESRTPSEDGTTVQGSHVVYPEL